MSRRFILFLLLLLPAIGHAVICKSIDADGVVSYADVPASECEQEVDLPDYSRYDPNDRGRRSGNWPEPLPVRGNVVAFERYTSMLIVQPEQNGTVRSNEGTVPVVIALQPALQLGHTIELTLDGRKVQGSFDGVAIELNGVDRGTHTLRAAVRDASGQSLIQSDRVRFTLRKVGLFEQQQPEPEPPVEPPPGYPASGTPPNYGNTGQPDYRPPSGGGSSYTPSGGATPGRTNPAFSPSYGR